MATLNVRVQVAEPRSGVPRSDGGGGGSGGSLEIGDQSLTLPDGTGAGAVTFL